MTSLGDGIDGFVGNLIDVFLDQLLATWWKNTAPAPAIILRPIVSGASAKEVSTMISSTIACSSLRATATPMCATIFAEDAPASMTPCAREGSRSVDDTTMVAHSSDVLQFINNDVPRFSHLTYHTEVPMWNVLTKNYLNYFDIEIRDHKGHLFPRSAIPDFVMVLMFEVLDEINENVDDMVAYQAQAYREGHPTSSGI